MNSENLWSFNFRRPRKGGLQRSFDFRKLIKILNSENLKLKENKKFPEHPNIICLRHTEKIAEEEINIGIDMTTDIPDPDPTTVTNNSLTTIKTY